MIWAKICDTSHFYSSYPLSDDLNNIIFIAAKIPSIKYPVFFTGDDSAVLFVAIPVP